MAQNDNEDFRETTLSPEVRRIRNSIIKKFAHEPLDIMAKFVKDVVENEEDTVKRLGAMAARVEILRMRILQIADSGSDLTFNDLTEEETEEHKFEEDSSEIVITSPNLADWVRLRIIENSEINGVRFPKGVVIDVSQEDGDRLLESGKASYVDEDEIADVKSDLNLQKKSNQQALNLIDDDLHKLDEEKKENIKDGVTTQPNSATEPLETEIPEGNIKENLVGADEDNNKVLESDAELEVNDAELEVEDLPEILETKVEEDIDDEEVNTSSDSDISNEKLAKKETKRKRKPKEKGDKLSEERNETHDPIDEPISKTDESADDLLAGFNLDEDTQK